VSLGPHETPRRWRLETVGVSGEVAERHSQMNGTQTNGTEKKKKQLVTKVYGRR